MGPALDEIARVLRPGGLLLVGFFDGAAIEPFDHGVATAYKWPVAGLSARLQASGFEIVETRTRTGYRHRHRLPTPCRDRRSARGDRP